MGAKIVRLLQLFDGRVPDDSTHRHVLALAQKSDHWSAGHAYRNVVRRLLLDVSNAAVEWQYHFEESCLESLYNETHPHDPFDSVSPFYVVPHAIGLTEHVGVPLTDVIAALRDA